MSENNKPASVGRDALGVLLMAVAVLSGVAIVMALTKPVGDNPSSFTSVYTGLVGAIGPVAGLFLALGIFVIGVRLWMVGISDRIGRDLLGVLVTTLTLSILVGTFAGAWAGRFGEVTGGSVTRRLTLFVGLPFGLVCVLLPAWLFWLRSYFSARNKNAAPQSQTLAPRVRAPADTARADALHADFAAVTADESAALLPQASTLLPRTAVEPPRRPSAISTSPPSSPSSSSLPTPATDVRLHGGIPAGTQPLAPHTSSQGSLSQGSTSHGTLPPAAPSSKHVQPRSTQPRSTHPPRAAAVPLEPRGELERPGESAGTHLASAEDLVSREVRAVPLRDLETPAAEPIVERREPARPANSLTGEPTTASIVRPILGAIDELELGELELGELELGEVELGELEPDELDSPDDLDGDETARPLGSTAEPATQTLAGEPARGDAAVTPLAQVPPPPSWEQPSLFDEPVDAYGTPEALVEALRKANEQTAERLGDEDPADEKTDDELPVAGLEDEGDVEDDAPAQRDERDEPELAFPSATEARGPQTRPESLFEVELQPQPAPAPISRAGEGTPRARQPKPTDEPASEAASEPVSEPRVIRELDLDAPAADDLVYRAGLLFLERGRVAVSMLQREFGLDFKAATELLDQLQKAGLIGPYLGGQRRDILLTRDEWAQRIGVS